MSFLPEPTAAARPTPISACHPAVRASDKGVGGSPRRRHLRAARDHALSCRRMQNMMHLRPLALSRANWASIKGLAAFRNVIRNSLLVPTAADRWLHPPGLDVVAMASLDHTSLVGIR